MVAVAREAGIINAGRIRYPGIFGRQHKGLDESQHKGLDERYGYIPQSEAVYEDAKSKVKSTVQ
jgi:hypothetical protein